MPTPQEHANALIGAMVAAMHSDPSVVAHQIDAGVAFCIECVAARVPCLSPAGDSLDFALSQFIASKVWTTTTGTGAPGLADLFRAYVDAGMIPLDRLQDGEMIPDMFPAGMAPLEWAIRRGAAEVAVELITLGADTGLVPVRPPGADGMDLIEFARANVLDAELRDAVVAGITESLMRRALVASADPGTPSESPAQNRRTRRVL